MEVTTHSKAEAVTALQRHIQGWLDGNPKRSLADLSRKTSAGESSLRRLMNNGTWPSSENVQKIVSYIGGGTHSQVLDSLPTPLRAQLQFELPYLKFEEYQNYRPMGEREKSLPDLTHQVIFERSSMGSGISLTEVKEMYGQYGLSTVENLTEAGLVTVNDGKVLCSPEFKQHSWSTSMYKKFFSEAVAAFYKTDSQINFLFVVNEAVSKKGYSQVMDVLENAHHAIQRIALDNPGEVPLTVGGMMDTLTIANVFEQKEGAQ